MGALKEEKKAEKRRIMAVWPSAPPPPPAAAGFKLTEARELEAPWRTISTFRKVPFANFPQ